MPPVFPLEQNSLTLPFLGITRGGYFLLMRRASQYRDRPIINVHFGEPSGRCFPMFLCYLPPSISGQMSTFPFRPRLCVILSSLPHGFELFDFCFHLPFPSSLETPLPFFRQEQYLFPLKIVYFSGLFQETFQGHPPFFLIPPFPTPVEGKTVCPVSHFFGKREVPFGSRWEKRRFPLPLPC